MAPLHTLLIEDHPLPLAHVDRAWNVLHANAPARAVLGLGEGRPIASCIEDGHALVGRLIGAMGDEQRRPVEVRSEAGVTLDVYAARIEEGRSLLAFVETSERAGMRRELERLQEALAEAERERSRAEDAHRALAEPDGAPEIIGRSAPVLRMIDQIERVAPTPSTVLIHGESGSGKELVARAIHARSARSGRALVTLNCAAMPESLLESELFGHERGAFTGADRRRPGKFELADGGTLFLDEIAELSPAAQAKLLRVLQDGEVVRVGGSDTISTDVRLIGASHRDLAERVRAGRFREDLFYRLNVFVVHVPALRERAEDIKELASFFHERHARRMARRVRPLSDRSVRRLLGYRFPGNVRELENAIERATLLMGEHDEELDVALPESPLSAGVSTGVRQSEVPRDVLLDLTLEQLQRLQITHALETTGYKVYGDDGAAKKLDIKPQTLLSRMDKLGIPRPRAARRARGL